MPKREKKWKKEQNTCFHHEVTREFSREKSNLFLNQVCCCFAEYWQFNLKYVVKRIFLEFLVRENFEDYFNYLNSEQEQIIAVKASLPGLYQFESVYSTLVFLRLLNFKNFNDFTEAMNNYYRRTLFIDYGHLFGCPKRLQLLQTEYPKFLCSFFFVYRYVALHGNRKPYFCDSGSGFIRLLCCESVDNINTFYHIKPQELRMDHLARYIECYGTVYDNSAECSFYRNFEDLAQGCCVTRPPPIESDVYNLPHNCDFRFDINEKIFGHFEVDGTFLPSINNSKDDLFNEFPTDLFEISIDKTSGYPLILKNTSEDFLTVEYKDNSNENHHRNHSSVINYSSKLSKIISQCNTSELAGGYLKDLDFPLKRLHFSKVLLAVENRNKNKLLSKESANINDNSNLSKPLICFPESMDCPHFKYYRKRYDLFSKFDEGIRLDSEGWYSVTPEVIAEHCAQRLATKFNSVIDCFVGCGGNGIQFAIYLDYVTCIDIDKHRLELAQNNARVYGVEGKMKFIHGDFFNSLTKELDGDCLFLAPPWGGIDFTKHLLYKFDEILYGRGLEMIAKAFSICRNVCLALPRNLDVSDVLTIANLFHANIEVEYHYHSTFHKMTLVYFGDCCSF